MTDIQTMIGFELVKIRVVSFFSFSLFEDDIVFFKYDTRTVV